MHHVCHNVVGALRLVRPESHFLQCVQKKIPFLFIGCGKLIIVGTVHLHCKRGGFLEWMRSTNSQEIMHFTDGTCYGFGRNDPTHPPTGESVSLGNGVYGHGTIFHPGDRSHTYMLGTVVKNMLVYLVHYCDYIPLLAEMTNEF